MQGMMKGKIRIRSPAKHFLGLCHQCNTKQEAIPVNTFHWTMWTVNRHDTVVVNERRIAQYSYRISLFANFFKFSVENS